MPIAFPSPLKCSLTFNSSRFNRTQPISDRYIFSREASDLLFSLSFLFRKFHSRSYKDFPFLRRAGKINAWFLFSFSFSRRLSLACAQWFGLFFPTSSVTRNPCSYISWLFACLAQIRLTPRRPAENSFKL